MYIVKESCALNDFLVIRSVENKCETSFALGFVPLPFVIPAASRQPVLRTSTNYSYKLGQNQMLASLALGFVPRYISPVGSMINGRQMQLCKHIAFSSSL